MNNVVPIASAPRDYNAAQLTLVRQTVAKDLNDAEFDMFATICRSQRLDPLRKQIHAIVVNKNNAEKRQVVFITGIDGYRAIADRSGQYRPDENPSVFTHEEALKNENTNPTGLDSATVTVFKMDSNGNWFPIKHTAHWEEFAPIEDEWGWDEQARKRKPTGKKTLKSNWAKMPRVMLAKCAEAAALRKGWPEDLGGLYVQEEMEQALSASETVEAHKQAELQSKIRPKDTIPLIMSDSEGMTYIPSNLVAERIEKALHEMNSPAQVEWFTTMNRVGLQDFWAKHKSDALDVKKMIEARITELSQGTLE